MVAAGFLPARSSGSKNAEPFEGELDLTSTPFFVSSTSGTTLEPNILASYCRARARELLGDEEAGRRFIAITDVGPPLEKIAERDGYRAVFHGVASIGGRYSARSDFGMIPVDREPLGAPAATARTGCPPTSGSPVGATMTRTSR